MTDLTDRHQLIEIAQRVKLPLFLVNVDVVLGDTLQSQLSRFTMILTGLFMNFLVISRASGGIVAEKSPT